MRRRTNEEDGVVGQILDLDEEDDHEEVEWDAEDVHDHAADLLGDGGEAAGGKTVLAAGDKRVHAAAMALLASTK